MSRETRPIGLCFSVSETVARALREKQDQLMLTIQDAAMVAVQQLAQKEGLDLNDYDRALELADISKAEDGEFYNVTFKLRPKQ